MTTDDTTGMRLHKWHDMGGQDAWRAWVRLLYPSVTFDDGLGGYTRAMVDGAQVGGYATYNDSSATVAPRAAKDPAP